LATFTLNELLNVIWGEGDRGIKIEFLHHSKRNHIDTASIINDRRENFTMGSTPRVRRGMEINFLYHAKRNHISTTSTINDHRANFTLDNTP